MLGVGRRGEGVWCLAGLILAKELVIDLSFMIVRVEII